MKDIITSDYQDCVSKTLLRNKSIIDIISKFNMTQAKIERCVVKSVTHCGCIEIDAKKQNVPEDIDDLENLAESHLSGKICDTCRENLEEEMGAHLFYFAALCDTLDMDMYDIILKEMHNLETLGKFSLR